MSVQFLPIIGGVFLAAGLVILAFLCLQIMRSARLDDRERRFRLRQWRSELKRILVIVGGLAAIGLGNLTFWMHGELRLYVPVSQSIPLGMVSILKTEHALPRLVYSAADSDGRESYEVFPVRDATFRLYGERIRWSPHLNFLGLGEYFKVTRLEFLPPPDSTGGEGATYHVDVRRGSTSLFSRLSSLGGWIPFVDTDSIRSPAFDASREFSVRLFVDSTGIALR